MFSKLIMRRLELESRLSVTVNDGRSSVSAGVLQAFTATEENFIHLNI